MRRLIGTGTTDSQGQVAITYTGTGAGKLDVIAECGDLQSETYSYPAPWGGTEIMRKKR